MARVCLWWWHTDPILYPWISLSRSAVGKYFSEDLVYAACRCIEKLVEGLGEAFQAQASILLEPLFEAGLSTPLVKTLQVC